MITQENIYLLGYMGSGKSTLMKGLNKCLPEYQALDLDNYIEEHYKISINSLFAQFGEAYFREVETRCLQDLAKCHNTLLATGGGTPCFAQNMQCMKETGISLYIKVSAQELTKRLFPNRSSRPLIKDFSQPEALTDFIQANLDKREAFYSQADIVVESDSASAEDLHQALQGYWATR